MENYKSLSPDLNNAIIPSLSQTIQQLVSISNVTPFQNVIVQNNAPFKPPASVIINVTWLLSLVLSLTHALSVAFPLSGVAQYHGARHNCPCTLHGIERCRPPRVVDSVPTLLHLSIFLFIAAIIDFLLQHQRLGYSAPLPHYVRDVFASPEMTCRAGPHRTCHRTLLETCFASLIAKKLSSDANSRNLVC